MPASNGPSMRYFLDAVLHPATYCAAHLEAFRWPACNEDVEHPMHEIQPKRPMHQRIKHELKEYGAVCLYLYVCLGALILYKEALLRAEGINYTSYGLAAIKALILGKF